jgi:actin related protein 2/3 complex, subunit 5
VIEVLNAVKTTDITSHLNALDMDSQDILMKYLYKGMEQPASHNTGVLLNWHEKVLSSVVEPLLTGQLVEVAGHGCIVRYISDRRTI